MNFNILIDNLSQNNQGDTLYQVTLKIKNVTTDDLKRQFRLVVESEKLNLFREYPVRISTNRPSRKSKFTNKYELLKPTNR